MQVQARQRACDRRRVVLTVRRPDCHVWLQVTLMLDNGSTREDLQLPSQTDDDHKLAASIRNDFDEGKDIVVSVLKVRPVARPVVRPVTHA